MLKFVSKSILFGNSTGYLSSNVAILRKKLKTVFYQSYQVYAAILQLHYIFSCLAVRLLYNFDFNPRSGIWNCLYW